MGAFSWIPQEGVDKENADKQGYLRKEGYAWKSVQRRWFVLKDEWLYYFNDHSAKTPIGGINLNGAILKFNPEEPKKKEGYGFTITAPRPSYQKENKYINRTYLLFADSIQDRANWISSINRALKSIMKPTILITGASGTVGSWVVKALLNKSVRILAAVHNNSTKVEGLGVEIIKIDVNNQSSIDLAMQNVDKLFILNPAGPKMAEQTKGYVSAAKKSGVRHIVRMGAGGSESRGTALARWHSDAEDEISKSGISYTFIRPNNFMSNFISFFAETIKKEGSIYAPYGDAKVSYVDPKDIGEAIATVITASNQHAGKSYTITGPESLSSSQIASEFSKQLNRQIKYIDIPAEAAILAMKNQGFPEVMTNALGELNQIIKNGYCAEVYADFERIVGRKPNTISKWLSNNISPFKGTTVLVIGATGMIGNEVINHLSRDAQSHDVRVLAAARDISKGSNFANKRVELVSINMDKPETLDLALKGVDRIFLLSPIGADMASQAKNVSAAAKKNGVKHIVRIGGIGSQYRAIKLGVWHDDAEKEIVKSGIPYTFLRPNNLMSNYILFSQDTIKYTGTIYGSFGNGKISLVHPSDVGAVASAVLLNPKDHQNKAYELTGSEAIDSDTVAAIFSEQLKKQVVYVDIPFEAAKKSMLDNGVPEFIADALNELSAVHKSSQASHVTDSVQKVAGTTPLSLHNFVAQNARAFKTETTVFVAGATGTTGSLVVKKLVDSKVRVVAGVRSLKKADPLIALGAEVVEIDLDSPESTTVALKGADKLFLLTAFNLNLVDQVKNLVNAAKKAGVQHIVKISGLGAETRNHPAALWHREGDKFVRDSGITYTILQPTNFFSNLILYGSASIKSQNAWYGSTGDGLIGWVDPADVAECSVVALTQTGHENKTYELTGPALLNATELTKVLSKALGKEVKYVDLPRDAIYQNILKMGASEKEAAARADMLEDFRQNGSNKLSNGVEKITGHPPTSAEAYFKQNAKYFKGNTVLVCGATGTVGSEVVKNLASDPNVRVLAGVRSASKAAPLASLDVEYVVVDFDNKETLVQAVQGVDAVFILTALANNMVEQTKNIVDAAKAAGVKFIVKSSAIGSDAKPGIQLGRWHNEAEEYIKQSGVPYCFVRPNSFLQNFIWNNSATIKNHGTLYMPMGDGAVSFVDSRDIGKVVAKILSESTKHAGRVYTLTGGKAYTITDVANAISKAVGAQVVYYDLPLENAKATWAASGWPQWTVDALAELMMINKMGYCSWSSNDVENIIGQPPTTLEEFVQEYKAIFTPQVPEQINVSIIGSGKVGSVLAKAFASAGHQVRIGSRDPKGEKTQKAQKDIGPLVSFDSIDTAVKISQVIIFAVPHKEIESAITSAGDLTGKIVVDATNPIIVENGKIKLSLNTTTSAGEKFAELTKGAKAVKAFNTIGDNIMLNPKFDGHNADLHIAGDDDFAKQYVAKLASDIGFSPLDVGGIESSRITEPLALLWVKLSLSHGRGIAFKVLKQ